MVRGLKDVKAGDTLISSHETTPFRFYCGDILQKPLCSVVLEPVSGTFVVFRTRLAAFFKLSVKPKLRVGLQKKMRNIF